MPEIPSESAARPAGLLGRVFPGWWVVGGTVVVQILLSSLLLQSYGAYAAVWRTEFGWSKTALATAFSLGRLTNAVLGPVQGWLLSRFGVRAVMRAGMVLLGLGFLGLAAVRDLPLFFLVFAVMSVGAALAGVLSLISVIVQWFERRRSTALAVMQFGQSVGGTLVPVVALGIVSLGWRTSAAVSGILVLTLGLAAVQLMWPDPESRGLLPDGRAPASPSRTEAAPRVLDYTLRQALATRAFWLLSIAHGLSMMLVSAVTVHLIVHLTGGIGLSLAAAAQVFAVMTAASLAGQAAGGVLGDRFDKRVIATAAVTLHVPAFLLLAFVPTLAAALGFCVLHGLAWGLRTPVMAAMRADYFGRSSFSTIMGTSSSIVMSGSVIGPVLVGLVADVAGGYGPAFVLLAVVAALSAVGFAFARKPVGPMASASRVTRDAT